MVSLDGLKTWFEYEVLITTLLVVAAVLFWVGEQMLGLVEIPALTPRFVVALAGVSLAVLVVVLWDAGR